MAKMTIQCVDAATIDYPYNTSDQYTDIISRDTAYVSINNIRYYIGYHLTEYTAAAGNTSNGGWNGILGDP